MFEIELRPHMFPSGPLRCQRGRLVLTGAALRFRHLQRDPARCQRCRHLLLSRQRLRLQGGVKRVPPTRKFSMLLSTRGDRASLGDFLLGRDDQVPFKIQGKMFKGRGNKALTRLRDLSGRDPGSGTGVCPGTLSVPLTYKLDNSVRPTICPISAKVLRGA